MANNQDVVRILERIADLLKSRWDNALRKPAPSSPPTSSQEV